VLTVVAGLLVRDGRILACRRRSDQEHPSKWEFPGGKVEAGEEPQEALIRELREELSIEATLGREFLRYEFRYPGKRPIELIFYWVESYGGELDGEFFAETKWMPADRLNELDFLEGDARVVAELASPLPD
jgi:8-oxo-dGTP diphosphatase